jgi:mono/diheme cytochrome c family protein
MHPMKTTKHLLGALLGTALVAGVVAGVSAFAAAGADTPQVTVTGTAQDALVKRGEYLARASDCIACHSAPGKPAFAGGLPIDSGHGIIYSTNITPDRQHGIGSYTLQQFADAVRKGTRADGTHLYPAMPYPSYAKITDEDAKALFAFFQSGVAPSDYTPPAAAMHFPFNLRWGMGLWNYAFASDAPFKPQPGWSADIARGAYLVEGMGHCGSCHTPRGFAMNEKALDSSSKTFLSGGQLDGWAVPSLRGLPRWNETAIVDYLQTGRNNGGAVAGEMTAVVQHSTSHLTDADLHSIAAYLKTLTPAERSTSVKAQGPAETAARLTAATGLTLGERLYLDNCVACHFVNGKGASRVFPELDNATVVNADNPQALVHVILEGARTPSTDKAPSVLVMPGFGKRLNDTEIAALATFLRQAWSNTGPKVSESDVRHVRAKLAN